MSSIIRAARPPAKPVHVCPAKSDVRPLAYALAHLTPGILDDPDPAAVDAARDILDDLLHEYEAGDLDAELEELLGGAS